MKYHTRHIVDCLEDDFTLIGAGSRQADRKLISPAVLHAKTGAPLTDVPSPSMLSSATARRTRPHSQAAGPRLH